MDKEKKGIVKAWILVISLGISGLSPVILCIALSYFIKSWLGTDLTLLFVILGIVSGAFSTWRMVKSQIGDDDEQTRLLSGIYDENTSKKDKSENTQADEDPLLEEYRRNNEQREKQR